MFCNVRFTCEPWKWSKSKQSAVQGNESSVLLIYILLAMSTSLDPCVQLPIFISQLWENQFRCKLFLQNLIYIHNYILMNSELFWFISFLHLFTERPIVIVWFAPCFHCYWGNENHTAVLVHHSFHFTPRRIVDLHFLFQCVHSHIRNPNISMWYLK